MIHEHDLTDMPQEQFEMLFNLAKQRCQSEKLKDILFELDMILKNPPPPIGVGGGLGARNVP
jgi:hypothetical protein